jgi:hypothetical protein
MVLARKSPVNFQVSYNSSSGEHNHTIGHFQMVGHFGDVIFNIFILSLCSCNECDLQDNHEGSQED